MAAVSVASFNPHDPPFTVRGLADEFHPYGILRSVQIWQPGFAVVEFEDLRSALDAVLQHDEFCREWDMNLDRICTDCIQALELLTNEEVQIPCRLQTDIQMVKNLLNYHAPVELEYCPRELNLVADALARHTGNNPSLTLFHQGYDRPRWLEEIAAAAGLKF